jgi:hypothetical protein
MEGIKLLAIIIALIKGFKNILEIQKPLMEMKGFEFV